MRALFNKRLPPPGRSRWLPLAAVALLLAAALAATLAAAPSGSQAAGSTNPAATAAPALPPGQAPNFRAIVQQAGPAVVGITVAGQHAVRSQDLPLDLNDPFFQFFRGLPGFPLRLPPGTSGEQPFRSQGSGFIIASDGLILTNAHVVREAKEVTVKLSDRRQYRARVLGEDAITDTAVLRIDAKGLPTVRLGDAQLLQVGDPVLAIGAPFGFEQSATQGIVSAKGRSLPGDSAVPFIQTDAAVNPGNSGGPLFDAAGAVVGINAQIYSQSGGFQGLSFAIPIGVALPVKDQILASGRAQHARLGVTAQDLSQGLAQSFGLGQPVGALVASVHEHSAAAAAGLQPGDVITAVDGQPIERAGDLSSRISLALPGDRVNLTVWRERAQRTVAVKLGQAEEEHATGPQTRPPAPAGALGLSLRPLSRDEMAQLHLAGGLLVEDVVGASEQAGVEAGDVLLSVHGQAVHSVAEVRAALAKAPRQVALLLLRDGERLFIPVERE